MALWLQNFVNTELKEEEQNIPKRIKSSSSVFMPSVIANGAKLGVAAVARATPLFLPRPEIMYINIRSEWYPATDLKPFALDLSQFFVTLFSVQTF